MGKDAVVTYETLFEILRRERNREEIQKIEDSFVAEVLDYLMQKQILPAVQEQNIFSISEREKSDRQISNAKRILRELYDRREKKIINMALNKAKTNTALINTANLLSHEKEMFKQIIDTLHTYRNAILAKLIQGKEITFVPQGTHSENQKTDQTDQTNQTNQIPSEQSEINNQNNFSLPSESSENSLIKESFEEKTKEMEEYPENEEADYTTTDKAKEPKVLKGDGFDSNVNQVPYSEESKENTLDTETESKTDTKKVRFLESIPKFIGPNLEMYGPYVESDEAELPSEIAAILINKKRAQNAHGS